MSWSYTPRYAAAVVRRKAVSWTGDTGSEFKPETTSRPEPCQVRRTQYRQAQSPQTLSQSFSERPSMTSEEIREEFKAKLKEAMEYKG